MGRLYMCTIIAASTKQIDDLIQIYDSANQLHDEKIRGTGTKEIFEELLCSNQLFILYKDTTPIGFISYREQKQFIELSGLYVKKEYQNSGYGQLLIDFFEDNNAHLNKTYLLQVLKSAEWAIHFYQKNNYIELKDNDCYQDIVLEPWSKTFIKSLH